MSCYRGVSALICRRPRNSFSPSAVTVLDMTSFPSPLSLHHTNESAVPLVGRGLRGVFLCSKVYVSLLRCLHWVGGLSGAFFVYVFLLCCLHWVRGLSGVLFCSRSVCFCFVVFSGLVGCRMSFCVVLSLCVFDLLSSQGWWWLTGVLLCSRSMCFCFVTFTGLKGCPFV